MRRLKRSGPIGLALMATVLAAALPLAACEEEGPAEEAGEKVDETINDAERGMDDATD